MIDRQIVEYMRYVHGAFNSGIALLILYHGWYGLRIRSRRLSKVPDFEAMKRHRKLGPYLVVMGIGGFLFGLALAYIDQGRVFEFPLHSALGIAVALSLAGTYVISRKIKAGPAWRGLHLALGAWLVCVYVCQVLVGLSVLF